MDKQTQYDILKTELLLTQQQTDKYDQLSTTTKTWAITLWAASTGWAFQVNRGEVLLLSVLILVVFWGFDALNKTFRQDYKKRRDAVASAMEHLFSAGELPSNFTSPKLPFHRWRDTIRHFAAIHIALPYILLTLVSLTLYFRF